ncbi:MAG TPA: NADP-dependent oxidoreductase [Rhizomicrobium sp.]|jgi:NADPH:quinone reductase-like Zn-dependent oxidoreductase|nr:NADP-dependent oxidoreductase [Rhizomicrobium sp.]
MTATMKSIRIHAFGGPDVLKQDEVPVPQPANGEVLVRVCAASVNPIDFKIREGGKADPALLPIAMGRDISGIVEDWGLGVEGLRKGDTIFAMLGRDRGGYADYAVVKAGEWAPKPAEPDHVHAAAVPLAAITAWQGLFDHGRLTRGQRVLIHGGAGGVGHFAIQLAKAKGAWVATTASKADLEFVRGLGADQAIDYKAQRFEDEVSDIDVVYDLIGGETQDRSFAVLKTGGALISTLTQPDKNRARAKDLRVAHYMAEPDAAQLAQIARLIDDGKVRPVVDTVFRLADAAKAQETLEKEHVRGKIVLEVDPAG